jgi:hypothetical protein
MVSTLSTSTFTSSAQTIAVSHLILVPPGFPEPPLIADSEAKMKNNGDKASPYFRPFWIKKIIRQMFNYTDFTICFV